MDYMVHSGMYFASITLSFVVIAAGIFFIWRLATPPPEDVLNGRRRIRVDGEEVVEDERRGGALNRMRRRNVAVEEEEESSEEEPAPARGRRGGREADEADENSEGEEGEEDGAGLGIDDSKSVDYSKLGAKKMRKMAEKEERARVREAMEADRKRRKEQEELDLEEQRKAKLEELEKKREEEKELERLREERAKKEREEYEAMKTAFSVEGEGEGEKGLLSTDSEISEFVAHVKAMKVVFLEDLAAKYNVKPQTIVEKISELETAGKLTGIIDERGKFIYISRDEMSNVALFIKQRGRVTLADIARESNRLIDLKPQAVATDLGEVPSQ